MVKEWTEDRIRVLDNTELLNLLDNARKRKDERVEAMCLAESERRKREVRVASPRVSADDAGSSGRRKVEIDADDLLVGLANELDSEFDLSEATARMLATTKFRPHRLLAKGGKHSKLGGVQKRGQVAVYRYISYRRDDASISLAAVMGDKADGRAVWRIDGPETLVPGKESRFPGLDIDLGVWCETFDEAKEKFRRLIETLAPKRRGST